MEYFEQQGVVLINLDQFWPVEHPIEPLEEDQPVKYPIPGSSQTKDNEANHEEEEFSGETLRRKAKLLEVIDRKEMVLGTERRPARRAVRRRQHRINDHIENSKTAATSLSAVSPRHPFQHSNSVTIFQKLDQP